MNQRNATYRLLLGLVLWLGLGMLAKGQDFEACNSLFKKLVATYNQSIEQNDPSLLRTSEYKQTLYQFQKAYTQYHRLYYTPADSTERLSNEAVALFLAGNASGARNLLAKLDSSQGSTSLVQNRALILLGNKAYQEAISLFSTVNTPEARLNTVLAMGQLDPEKAIEYAQQHPRGNTDGKANFNLGVLYKKLERYDEAFAELNAAVRQHDNPAYRTMRGDIFMLQKKYASALKDYEKLARRSPKAHVRYANALLLTGDYTRAKAEFDDFLLFKPKVSKGEAYMGKAHTEYALGNLKEAARMYRLAATVRPDDPAPICGEANLLLAKKEYKQAYLAFRRILVEYPDYTPAKLGQAMASYGLNRFEEALDAFDAAESLFDPTNRLFADSYLGRAYARYFSGNSAAALEDFETVLRLKPSAYEAMVGLSNIMIDARKYPQAGQYLAKALNYEKKNDKMWSNYGNLLLHFNMYQKAYNVFRTATRLDPTNRIAQNGWGISLLENDELDRSIQLFDSLVVKNPTTSYLLNNRGIVHAYLGNRDHQAYRLEASQQRYQWAFNDFKEGLLNAPSKRFYNVNKGNVHRIWEEYDLAQTSYEAHQDKSALNNLGVMYAGMQRPKDGLYYLNIALQIDSTYRVFKYNMALLIRTNQARTTNAVASAKASPFGDIGIKYSRDGFVTIYLYDYEYDTLHVKGAHFVPPPAEVIQEDFFIPIYNFKLLRYSTQKLAPKKKKGAKDREQRVKLPGRRSRTGTDCPV